MTVPESAAAVFERVLGEHQPVPCAHLAADRRDWWYECTGCEWSSEVTHARHEVVHVQQHRKHLAAQLATALAQPDSSGLEAMIDRLAERHVELQEVIANALNEMVEWRDRLPRTRENHTYENGRQDGVDAVVLAVRSALTVHLKATDTTQPSATSERGGR